MKRMKKQEIFYSKWEGICIATLRNRAGKDAARSRTPSAGLQYTLRRASSRLTISLFSISIQETCFLSHRTSQTPFNGYNQVGRPSTIASAAALEDATWRRTFESLTITVFLAKLSHGIPPYKCWKKFTSLFALLAKICKGKILKDSKRPLFHTILNDL